MHKPNISHLHKNGGGVTQITVKTGISKPPLPTTKPPVFRSSSNNKMQNLEPSVVEKFLKVKIY